MVIVEPFPTVVLVEKLLFIFEDSFLTFPSAGTQTCVASDLIP
jgi:hypothetical protein